MGQVLTREIVLHITDRPDGGLRVLSDDVKGLFLGGSDRERIWSVVGSSLKGLLRANHDIEVVRMRGPMTAPVAGDVVVEVEYQPVEHRTAA